MKNSINFTKKLWNKWKLSWHVHESTYCALEEAYLQGVIDGSTDKEVKNKVKKILKLVGTDDDRWADDRYQ